jgi:ATP-dependent Clp protease adaptor protein ClpS
MPKETEQVGGASQTPGPSAPVEGAPTTSETDRASGARTSTATKTRTSPPRVDKLPPFKVLLHNDDHSDMLDVVKAIVELTPLKKESAVQRMLEAHARGVSLLLTTHKERAELYREQFHSKRLTVSIEPGN